MILFPLDNFPYPLWDVLVVVRSLWGTLTFQISKVKAPLRTSCLEEWPSQVLKLLLGSFIT